MRLQSIQGGPEPRPDSSDEFRRTLRQLLKAQLHCEQLARARLSLLHALALVGLACAVCLADPALQTYVARRVVAGLFGAMFGSCVVIGLLEAHWTRAQRAALALLPMAPQVERTHHDFPR